jgi:8-oxo-dGTP diphosphatase
MARRSIAGICLENGKLFIARRLPGGDLGGKWEFPGGKLEAGETDADALAREFTEELDVSIKTGPLLGAASFEHNGKEHTVNAYRVFFENHNVVLTEHSEYRWAGIADIETLEFAGSDRKLLSAIQETLKAELKD